MTEYTAGPHSFHLGSGECVLLTGKSGCRQLLQELSHRPACALVSRRKPLLFKKNERVEGALALLELKPDGKWTDLDAVERFLFGIALALRRKVEVLLLDNPTRDLDPEERQRLLSALREFARKTGIAILFFSYDLSDSLAIAHRVLAFTPAGNLVESTPDTREEVLRAAFPLLQI
jgi:ABC-type multidrug transport system ATPase subunit